MNANIGRCHEDYTCAENLDFGERQGSEEVSNEPPKQVFGFSGLHPTDSTSESTGRVSSSSDLVVYQSESCEIPNASNPDSILAVSHSPSSSQGLIISRRSLQPFDTSNLIRSNISTNSSCSSAPNNNTMIIPNSGRIRQRQLLHLSQPNNNNNEQMQMQMQIQARMRFMRHLIMESVLYTRRPSLVEFNSLTSQYGTQDVQVSGQSQISYVPETDYQYMNHIWLDVDNMSYEELLALEDHIGYVSTGLSEDAISTSLRHSKYFVFAEENAQRESCTICQESYVEDDELGTLDCGHGFHIGCINRWLACKNSCPICKSTGLDTSGLSLHQIDA